VGTTRVNFRLPEELVQKADVAAAVGHTNRTEIVKEALKTYLREVENRDAYKEAVVELYLDEEIGFGVLEAFLGRQDAESVRASKSVLEGGEDLAEDLAER
jgi:metal-responsive CopG/Arc/MetJ family transcriptional regulator